MSYELKKLIDVAEIISGGTPQSSNPNYFGGDTIWLTPKDLSNHSDIYIENSERTLTAEGIKNSSAKLIPEGSVTLSSRAPIGYVAIPTKQFTTNQGMKSFVPKKDLYNEYLYYYLLYSRSALEKEGSGTTFKEISKSKLEDFQIPIPTLQEQKQIVSKIKECFNYLDKAEEKLDQLEKRNNNLLKSFLHKVYLRNINAYRSITLKDACSRITDGSHFSPKTTNSGYPYITVKDIDENGHIDFENCKKISEENFENLAKLGCKPKLGDVLFSKDGTVGKVARIGHYQEFVVLSSLAIITPNKDIITDKFLELLLNTPEILNQAIKKKTGTAIRRITLTNLKQITIPIPPTDVQQEQYKRYSEYKEILETNKDLLSQDRTNIKLLHQSILKKAFEGKLI